MLAAETKRVSPELEKARVRTGMFASCPEHGFNGAFEIQVNGEMLRIIASDGLGWQHVSVSKSGSTKCPNWEHMCRVKELFWGDDEWVMQFHPPKKDYVNNHPGCLHLWRPTQERMPVPDAILVGHKSKTPDDIKRMGAVEVMRTYRRVNAA